MSETDKTDCRDMAFKNGLSRCTLAGGSGPWSHPLPFA